MQHPISPWHAESVELRSPDGSLVAALHEPSEFAMGSPTSGDLKVSNGLLGFNCNPSMVWSDDSIFLAVPQWFERMQRLLILNVVRRRRVLAPGEFRVLELHSFEDGIVKGIDSPIHEPRSIAIDVRGLFDRA